MLKKHSCLALNGICLLLLGQAGCAAKKTITSTYPPFRLQDVGDSPLLLTPSVTDVSAADAPLILKRVAAISPDAAANPCTIEQAPFHLTRDPEQKNTFMITLPAREEWLALLEGASNADNRSLFDELDDFLASIDRLQASGCVRGGVDTLRSSILQSLPTRPNQSLLNAYGYRGDRNSINLKPSIRVKIERAYFRGSDDIEVQSPVKNFQGLSWSYFEVKSGPDGKISFQRFGNLKFSPPSLAHTDAQGKHDLALGSLPPQSSYRLFFYSYLVPTSRKRSATIIDGAAAAQLDAVEAKLRANPAESCENVAASLMISCFEFQGFVTATAEVGLSANGKLIFLDWGAKVENVLPPSPPASVMRSLRIQRRFKDGYSDILFDASNEDVLSLVLVGGDRLTWTSPASALH
jgi:hypothetical protein